MASAETSIDSCNETDRVETEETADRATTDTAHPRLCKCLSKNERAPTEATWCACFKAGEIDVASRGFETPRSTSFAKSGQSDTFPLLTHNLFSVMFNKRKRGDQLEQREKKDELVDLSDVFYFCSRSHKCGFGKAYLVTFLEIGVKSELMVLKITQKMSELAYYSIKTEVACLRKLQGVPFFRRILGTFQTKKGFSMLNEFTERLSMAELVKHTQGLGKEAIVFYASEITCALGFLHDIGVIHRSLSADNIMIDIEGHIVLSDLGFVSFLSKTDLSLFDGPPYYYLAPEMVKGELYTKDVDWWALGVVLFYCLYNRMPFSGNTKEPLEVLFKIIQVDPPFIDYPQKQQIVDFCRSLLSKIPRCRRGFGPPDAEKVKEHPCFEGVDWIKTSQRLAQPPPYPQDAAFAYKSLRNIMLSETQFYTVPSDNDMPSQVCDQEILPLELTNTFSSRSSSNFSVAVWPPHVVESLRQCPEDRKSLDLTEMNRRWTSKDRTPRRSVDTAGSQRLSIDRADELELLKQDPKESTRSKASFLDITIRRKSLDQTLTKSRTNIQVRSREDQSNNSNIVKIPGCGVLLADQVRVSEPHPAHSASDSGLVQPSKTREKPDSRSLNKWNLCTVSDSNLCLQASGSESHNALHELGVGISLKPTGVNTLGFNVCFNRAKSEKDSTLCGTPEWYIGSNEDITYLRRANHHASAPSLTAGTNDDVYKQVYANLSVGENITETLKPEKRAYETGNNYENASHEKIEKLLSLSETSLNDKSSGCEKVTDKQFTKFVDDHEIVHFINSNNCNYFDICLKGPCNKIPKEGDAAATYLLNKGNHFTTDLGQHPKPTIRIKSSKDADLLKKNPESRFQSRLLCKKLSMSFDREHLSSTKKCLLAKLKSTVRSPTGFRKYFFLKPVHLHAKEQPQTTQCAEDDKCSSDLGNGNTLKTLQTGSEKCSPSNVKSKQSLRNQQTQTDAEVMKQYNSEPNLSTSSHENKHSYVENPGEIILPATFLDLIVTKTVYKTSCALSNQRQNPYTEDIYRQFCTENSNGSEDSNSSMSSSVQNLECGVGLPTDYCQETTFPVSPFASPLTSCKYYKPVWRRTRLVSHDHQSILYWTTSCANEEQNDPVRRIIGVRKIFRRWRQKTFRSRRRRTDDLPPVYVYRIVPLITRTKSRGFRKNVAVSMLGLDEAELPLKQANAKQFPREPSTENETSHPCMDKPATSKSNEIQDPCPFKASLSTASWDRLPQHDVLNISQEDPAFFQNVSKATKFSVDSVDSIEFKIDSGPYVAPRTGCFVLDKVETPKAKRTLQRSKSDIGILEVVYPLESQDYESSSKLDRHRKRSLSYMDIPKEQQFDVFIKSPLTNVKTTKGGNICPDTKILNAEDQSQLPKFSESIEFLENSEHFSKEFNQEEVVSLLPRKSKSFESHWSGNAFRKTSPTAYSTNDVLRVSSNSPRRQCSAIGRTHSMGLPYTSFSSLTGENKSRKDLRYTTNSSVKKASYVDEQLEESKTAPLCSNVDAGTKEEIANTYQRYTAVQDEVIIDEDSNVDETLEQMRARFARALEAKEKMMADADTIALWDTWQCPPHAQRFCGDGNGISDMSNLSFDLYSQRSRTLREHDRSSQGQVVGTLTIEYTKPPVEGFVVLG